jgi:branched-chain amino acid transport system substrate-binding protein
VHFISLGAREAAKKRGLREAAFLEWDFGNRDFGPIAARLKDAKPDFVWVGGLGLEGNLLIDAMRKIDYMPPLHFHLFPAPGPLLKAPGGENALAATTFEEHAPFTDNPVAVEFIRLYHERGAKAGLPDTSVENQSAISYSSWQTLEAAVTGAKSLDDKAIAQWLKKNHVDAIVGRLRWDGPFNYIYGSDLYKVKQNQNGKWVVIWPKEFAAPGVRLITP